MPVTSQLLYTDTKTIKVIDAICHIAAKTLGLFYAPLRLPKIYNMSFRDITMPILKSRLWKMHRLAHVTLLTTCLTCTIKLYPYCVFLTGLIGERQWRSRNFLLNLIFRHLYQLIDVQFQTCVTFCYFSTSINVDISGFVLESFLID